MDAPTSYLFNNNFFIGLILLACGFKQIVLSTKITISNLIRLPFVDTDCTLDSNFSYTGSILLSIVISACYLCIEIHYPGAQIHQQLKLQ